MTTIGGHIVTTAKGWPIHHWGGTTTVFPDAAAAEEHRKKVVREMGKRLGPLEVRSVELRIREPRKIGSKA